MSNEGKQMFSVEEYKTTIAVLRAHSCEDLADGFRQFQKNAERREAYTEKLGEFAESLDRSSSVTANGERLISKLVEDGWSPPKGLMLTAVSAHSAHASAEPR